jgi:cobalt/nickel transport system permease protein
MRVGVGVSGAMLEGIDPRVRILAAVALAAVVVGLHSAPALTTALVFALALVVAAGPGRKAVLRRVLAVDGLIVAIVAVLPFTVAGEPVLAIGPLRASREGIAEALAILARVNAIGLGTLALMAGIEPLAFGHALRRLGTPDKLVQIVFLTARYIDVLGRERRRLARAMAARGFRPRSDRHTWRSLGYFTGMLLVRGFERAERVHAAMKCRGYRGSWPAPGRAGLARRDRSFAGAWLAGLAILIALEAT